MYSMACGCVWGTRRETQKLVRFGSWLEGTTIQWGEAATWCVVSADRSMCKLLWEPQEGSTGQSASQVKEEVTPS